MPEPSASLVIDFGADSEPLADVGAVLEALNLLVSAAVILAICDTRAQYGTLFQARELLRHAVVGRGQRWRPRSRDWGLVEDALFGEQGEARDQPQGRTRDRNSPMMLSEYAVVGTWVRRELAVGDPELYRELFAFARVDSLRQDSPIKLAIGVTGATAGGLALAGPFGVAPAALLVL